MLELIIKLIIFTIMPISGFFVIKNLIDSDEKIYSVKNILIIVGLCITNLLIYTSDYRSYTTLLNFCFLVIGYKYIFKISFYNQFYCLFVWCFSYLLLKYYSMLLFIFLLVRNLLEVTVWYAWLEFLIGIIEC